MAKSKSRFHVGRYVLSGILTVIPLWVTWLVFDFIFRQLSTFGMPWIRLLTSQLDGLAPGLGQWLMQPWLDDLLAVLVTLAALYILGWSVNRVIGRRILELMDAVLNRVPLVQSVYGAVKKLVSVMQQEPQDIERVVLINFPSSEMKAVGLVTRTLEDEHTGQKLAAVYVPTTPNPTSGYMEIVPVERLVPTDWTIDEAMSFIISGGTVGPDRIDYSSRGGRQGT
ncbi:MAG: DUF502 domain-containing protein [Pseudomonadota bacterium]